MGGLDARLLLALAVIVGAAQVFGLVAERLRQPRVLGEIVAGIVLGPSVLGALWPVATRGIFPSPVVDHLQSLSTVGLVLFMFLVGRELDPHALRGQAHRVVLISNASIALPFVSGALLGLWLHQSLNESSDLLPFCLFTGAAMSVTAFPVLARILRETRLDETRVGAMTLVCAAVDDVTAWCVLAAVLAVSKGDGAASVALTLAETAVFGLVMWFVVRPALERIRGCIDPLLVVLALAAGALTASVGIHAIFGAFMAGLVVPRRTGRSSLMEGVSAITATVLLPVFFMTVGLSSRIGLVDTPRLWLAALVVLLVAVLGKFGGAALMARVVGESSIDATTIGVLMNTRGLTEIVILSVGLQREIIGPTMFTIMVLMALSTTGMASPLLRMIRLSRTGAVPRTGGPTT